MDMGAAWHRTEKASSLLLTKLAMEMDALIRVQCCPPGHQLPRAGALSPALSDKCL